MYWRPSRFQFRLALIGIAAVVLRVAYVVTSTRHQALWGDAYVYHWQAYYLLHGRGFVAAFEYRFHGQWVAAADEPPLWTLTLAAADVVGIGSYMQHKILACLIGAMTVVAVGFLGRKLGGERLGLLAAGIAALYSNFWVNDGIGQSETLLLLAITLVVLAGYRCWESPSPSRAAVLGLASGLCALIHPETLLLAPLLGIPLLWRAGGSWRRRLGFVAVVGVVTALTIAPWVGRNLAQFDKPVLLSDGADITLAATNCDTTYSGPLLGYWSHGCIENIHLPDGDQSVRYVAYRHEAFDYMRRHASRVPVVVLARLGREWNLYRPIQMTSLDVIEGRPLWVNRLGLASFYLLFLFAIGGGVSLHRKRVPLWPLVSLAVVASVAGALAFGNTRYRVASEVALALLAAAGIEALWCWLSRLVGRENRTARTDATTRADGTAGADVIESAEAAEPAFTASGTVR